MDHDHFAGELTIDPEFTGLLPPLSDEEEAALEADLIDHGCREPLLAWQDDDRTTLVDGHNRHRLCAETGVAYRVKLVTFPDRAAAMQFIISNQFARRNLSEDHKRLLRGKRYRAEKCARGGDRKSKGQVAPLTEKSTAERLGDEYGVSADTIKRDEKFAEAVDKIGEVSAEARQNILSGEVKLSADAVAAVVKASPEEVKEIAEAVATKSVRKVQGKPKLKTKADPDEALPEKTPEHLVDIFKSRPEFDRIIKAIGTLIGQIDALKQLDAGIILAERYQTIETDLKNAQAGVKLAKPHRVCPYCNGAGCAPNGSNKMPCRGAGWVVETVKGPGK